MACFLNVNLCSASLVCSVIEFMPGYQIGAMRWIIMVNL